MPDPFAAAAVLREYALPPPSGVEALGNAGGFSGAALWRVSIGPALFCLRRWPAGTNSERVATIDRILRRTNLSFLPIPLLSRRQQGVVSHDGILWTLSPWMPGEAIAHPSALQLRNAMQALAAFHAAVSDDPQFPRHLVGSPATLTSRLQTLRDFDLAAIQNAPLPPGWERLEPVRRAVHSFFSEFPPHLLLTRHEGAKGLQLPLQICLRDVWSAHVLFTGDEVTGLIDFDAMRVDSVALDLARLLGSYAGDDSAIWSAGLEAYDFAAKNATTGGLSLPERELARRYDELAVILTPVQWLSWILLQQRQFEPETVLPRIAGTIQRLEHLRHHLRTSPQWLAE